VRKVELAKIKPQLLEKEGEGRLVEAFCAGVWGGIGMLIFLFIIDDPEVGGDGWRKKLEERG